MIVTLTAHPSLDRTITLDAPLRPGEVQAAASAREDAGGKGINVSRVVAAAGAATVAVLPLAAGDPFEAALASAGIATRPVRVTGHARANLTITVPARVAAALVTLGAAGAVLVTADGAWAAAPPRVRVVSTVGAGDSSLAGYLLAEEAGAGPEQRLRSAVRYGSAAASLPGTQAPAPADLPAGDVPVTRLTPTTA
jgi:fructose-1-phosphate kinase PfkB-like protein